MDIADKQCAVSCQGALLGQHGQLLQALVKNSTKVAKVADLTQQVALLAGPTPQLAGPTASAIGTSPRIPSTHICDPELFQGDLDKCWGFLLLCRLVFQQKARLFTNDFAKVSYLVSPVSRQGAGVGRGGQFPQPPESHVLCRVGGEPEGSLQPPRTLPGMPSLCQGNRSVADFSVKF